MPNSTNQERHRMTVKHRYIGVVLTTFFGLSTVLLAADEAIDTDDLVTQDQTANTTVSDKELISESERDLATPQGQPGEETDSDINLDVVPEEDQLSKTFLQELSKEKFREYMLSIEKYSKNDREALLDEYHRRCSDDSTVSFADLCPDDIEPDLGNTFQVSEPDLEEPEMPQLTEQSIEVRSTVQSTSNDENVVERDPRIKNKDKKDQLLPSWQRKPSNKEEGDFSILEL